jgi:flagellar biosynthesis/type III secretory pathway protein FliH
VAADFISLADYLHRRRTPPNAACAAGELVPAVADDAHFDHGVVAGAEATSCEPVQADTAHADVMAALHDARLFRARLGDAFDDAAARLLRELAAEVLVRELRLAPCDVDALVARVRERAPVVRVRVAPDEVARVHGVPVVGDERLASGDAIVELAGGALDVRLGVRLASVLEAFA